MLLRPSGASSRPARAWDPPTHNPTAAVRTATAVGLAGHVPGRPGPVRRGVRLAIDVGSVRIGVARSDPGGVLASPLTVVRSGPGDLDALAGLVASAGAIEVIVGLPTSLSGREGTAAAIARDFAAQQGIAEAEALEKGMETKAVEFVKSGAELYRKV